jgi:hypothetical protein
MFSRQKVRRWTIADGHGGIIYKNGRINRMSFCDLGRRYIRRDNGLFKNQNVTFYVQPPLERHWPAVRVTKLGEFSTLGKCLMWSFLKKITKVAQFFWLLFSTVKVVC